VPTTGSSAASFGGCTGLWLARQANRRGIEIPLRYLATQSDMRTVESTQTKVLLQLGDPRFRNFSDAAGSALRALSEAIPGTILLGQLDPDEHGWRVIDVSGVGQDGVRKGAILPLAVSVDDSRVTADGDEEPSPDAKLLDSDALRLLGAQGFMGIPLEMSDGTIVGVLAAVDTSADAYDVGHTALLSLAARLLGHQWESVEMRAELRRLRRRASTGADVDAETGIPNRKAFLGILDHEWRLANRGTVESVLVTIGIGPRPEQAPVDNAINGSSEQAAVDNAISKLALRITSEVLEGSIRVTDRAGRVGSATLAAVLVGCRLHEAPAFLARFQAALRRVTEVRDPQVELSLGVQALADTPSPEAALKSAEAALGIPEEGHPEVAQEEVNG
jgi:GGDEF domain-containing protein